MVVCNDAIAACDILMEEMFNGTNLDVQVQDDIHAQNIYDLKCLIDKCVLYGESNSILVVGPRGCGKTHVVDSTIAKVLENKQDDVSIVRLNGLLQTDDNIALEEITRQLKLENVVQDMVFGSFEQKMQFLLESLRAGSKDSQPIVFILDEFDLFANHRNQTLLYNLFDIAQTKQTPISVIGVTCRLDVTELLEKRVKSRFSHRYIYMFHRLAFSTLVDTLAFWLKLPDKYCKRKASYAIQWNKRMDTLLQDSQIKDEMLFRFNMITDMHSVKQMAAKIVGNCRDIEATSLPEEKHFLEAFKVLELDCKAAMLQGTSILELCLIIAMKHLTEIYESGEPFNFQMVYAHYKKFSERKSSMKTCPKPIAMKAFEHLIDLEIVKPVDHSSALLKQYRSMRLLVTSKEIENAVLHYSGCPADVKRWSFIDSIH